MRFIHTGDWHLGRLFHNLHLTQDQRFTLEGLLRLAQERNVDAVVVAGDVYDRAVPPTEAVELLDDILAELSLGLEIPVILVAGNHDSPVRLQYLSGLVGRMGVHVVGLVGDSPRGAEITGRTGERVVFWPLAYTDPETARFELGREDIHTHEEAIAAQVELIKPNMDATAHHVLVGHAFVTGGEQSDSERPLSVGGTGQVSASLFDDFNYVALGHLHRPQKVTNRVRYAGSLLKYSFDEAEQDKSVTVVELDEIGTPTCELVPLPVRHDLARISGTFEQLLEGPESATHRDSYIEAVLVDGDSVLDPMERLRKVYPHILSLVREGGGGGLEVASPAGDVKARSTEELFDSFFEDVTGTSLSKEQAAELASVLAELDRVSREVPS